MSVHHHDKQQLQYISMNLKTSPFTIHVPEEDIQDLYRRIKNTRFPEFRLDSDWKDGTDSNYLYDLLTYWVTDYSWREREKWFNSFDHYKTDIDGVNLHFIHAKSKRKDAMPLLLMTGWPSSFVQLLDIIPLLTDEINDHQMYFDVIAVSMPGYAFSDVPKVPGMNFEFIAELIVKLMVDKLGYECFAARGSDQGAMVQQQIALKYPKRLIGVHRSGITPFLNPLPTDLSEEEIVYQQQVTFWEMRETGYAKLQASRPQTLIPALADSPAGLAAWMIEKFQRWGDCGTDPVGHFGRDRILDNICLHWFVSGGSGAIRLYYESAKDSGLTGRVEVPTAIAMPLRDGITVPAPRRWAERFYNVQQWTVMERGGHFPEWEIPAELAIDIRSFFNTLRFK